MICALIVLGNLEAVAIRVEGEEVPASIVWALLGFL